MSTEVVLPPNGPSIEPTRVELSKSAAKYAKRKALRPYLILAPTLLLTLGILIPFFAAIYLSFTDFTLRSSDYSFIGFDNYGSMLQNPDFWHSLAVTLQYAFLCTTVEMLLGIGAALLLNEENPVHASNPGRPEVWNRFRVQAHGPYSGLSAGVVGCVDGVR